MTSIGPGARFGDLTIQSVLGRGAFGTVYLAEDQLIGRRVALKVVAGGDAANRELALREARLVGQLNHPHIVTLYRVHPPDEGDRWAYEFEYVEGGTLADLLEDGERLPVERAAAIATGMARGLAAAHEAGVVHGDIKPANVLIADPSDAKLADFGLARLIGDLSLKRSRGSGPAGTPVYMAPEVIMGDPPGAAADVWSLGVVLYRMLAGRLPFEGHNLHALIHSIQNREPASLPASVPAGLDRAMRLCLVKHPEERPREARTILRVLSGDESVRMPTTRAPHALAPGPRLCGRGAQIDTMRARLDAAVASREGSCTLITGEEGIGKTEFVRHLLNIAGQRGIVPIRAHTMRLEGVLRPLLAALYSGTGAYIPPGEDSTRFESTRTLVKQLQESQKLRLDADAGLGALQRILAILLRHTHAFVAIEDIQDGDRHDVELIRHLRRSLVPNGLVLVATARSDLGGGLPSHVHLLGSEDGVRELALPRLDAVDTFRLLDDQAAGARVAPEVAHRVHEVTGGNPGFCVELLRHMEQCRCVVRQGNEIGPGPLWEETPLPRRLEELVALQLKQLAGEERRLLDIASVAGHQFEGGVLAAVAQQPELAVLRALQEIYRRTGLVVPRARGYVFGNRVNREVIYADLAPDLRRLFHRALAEQLEVEPPDRAVAAEALAVHWESAGEPQRAMPYFRQAAREATRRQEMGRSIDLARRGGVTPDRLDADTAIECADLLLPLMGFYAVHDRPAAEAIAAALKSAGDDELFLRALTRESDWIYRVEGRGAVDEKGLARAADELPSCFEKAKAHYLLGVIHKHMGELDTAEWHLKQAAELLPALDNPGLQASVLDQLGSVALRREELEEAETLYGESARISRRAGREPNAAASDVNRLNAAFHRGALDGIEPQLRRSIRVLELQGSRLAAQASTILAQVQYSCGEMASALETLEGLRDGGYVAARRETLNVMGSLLVAQGRMQSAFATLQEAASLAEESGGLDALADAVAGQALGRCFAASRERARPLALTCIDLAATQGFGVRDHVALRLGQASIAGLDLEAGDGIEPETLVRDRDGRTPAATAALALCKAARVWQSDCGADEIDAAANALANPCLGLRQAEHRILAGLLGAEAERRRGRNPTALSIAAEAYRRAERLGHAWYALELLHRFQPVPDSRQRLRSRLAEMAADLGEARERVFASWLPGD